MLQEIKQNPFLRFIVVAVLLYAAWFTAYELFIHPWGKLDRLVIDNLIGIASGMLDVFGYPLTPVQPDGEVIRTIGIDGAQLLWVGDECNGLTLFAIFIVFMLAFPGPWKKKLWFIPIGMLLIHLMNAIRVAALAVIVKENPEALDFNHTYVFTTLVYGFIFLLWYIWAVRMSGIRDKKGASDEA